MVAVLVACGAILSFHFTVQKTAADLKKVSGNFENFKTYVKANYVSRTEVNLQFEVRDRDIANIQVMLGNMQDRNTERYDQITQRLIRLDTKLDSLNERLTSPKPK